VVIVDEQHYTACTVPSNAPTLTSGDDRVTLDHAGKWFFICGVEDHCESGMKLAVNVN
jgi:alpha-D-ribose 1-methylphosphonate 5-phosphate C-P lyase